MTVNDVEAPRIVLDEVSIWFGPEREVSIANDLSLSLGPGQSHCFAGRSGSGKTTLLRTLAGFTDPNTGTVHWNGTAVRELSEDQRARHRRGWIGYLDQSASTIDGFTTLENVLMPAVPGRRTRDHHDRATGLLDRLGLRDRQHSRAEILSGGERQRAVLARALLLKPQVIVLDEPTASLDRRTADLVVALLDRCAHHGHTIITASHDPAVIQSAHTTTHLE